MMIKIWYHKHIYPILIEDCMIFKTHPIAHKIIVISNMYRNNELLISNCSCLYCRVVYQLTEVYNVQQYQNNSIDHMNLRCVLQLTAGQNSSVLYGTHIYRRIVYQSLYFGETAEMRATRLLYRKLNVLRTVKSIIWKLYTVVTTYCKIKWLSIK